MEKRKQWKSCEGGHYVQDSPWKKGEFSQKEEEELALIAIKTAVGFTAKG